MEEATAEDDAGEPESWVEADFGEDWECDCCATVCDCDNSGDADLLVILRALAQVLLTECAGWDIAVAFASGATAGDDDDDDAFCFIEEAEEGGGVGDVECSFEASGEGLSDLVVVVLGEVWEDADVGGFLFAVDAAWVEACLFSAPPAACGVL